LCLRDSKRLFFLKLHAKCFNIETSCKIKFNSKWEYNNIETKLEK
jgi:hypothetical protein